jgi:hypothetical protein
MIYRKKLLILHIKWFKLLKIIINKKHWDFINKFAKIMIGQKIKDGSKVTKELY